MSFALGLAFLLFADRSMQFVPVGSEPLSEPTTPTFAHEDRPV